ncbi:MAG: hypothetical protein H0V49_11535 [Nocardioidaceae bacterium]|nr:hypothetical protein [Nocardioidaceae bacterium]
MNESSASAHILTAVTATIDADREAELTTGFGKPVEYATNRSSGST